MFQSIDDIPEEHRSKFEDFENSIERTPIIVLEPFTINRLTFVDSSTLSDENQSRVIVKIQEALSAMQSGVTCEEHGENVMGDVENIRLGVFDARDNLIGAWYIGAIYTTGVRDTYEARFMPWFPSLDNAASAQLTGDVINHLLSNEHSASPSAIRFSALRYVIKEAASDTWAQIHHLHLIRRSEIKNTTSDTAIPEIGRSEITLSK